MDSTIILVFFVEGFNLLRRMVYASFTGRELTASEVRNSLSPFLETLGAEQDKEGLVDMFISFPEASSVKTRNLELYYFGDSFTSPVLGEVKFGSFPQLQAHMVHGKLPLSVVYLLEVGFPPAEVADVMSQFPSIASYSVEGKVRPIIDFLLGLGIHATDVPKIILKRPQLFGCSLEENIKPTVALLKGLGVDSEGWVKILSHFPHILTYSVGKVQQVVSFLSEIGLSSTESGKVITRFPQIIGYSVSTKLTPFADYFKSIGVKDLKTLVSKSPQLLGLSLELNIKATILFFSEKGYTTEELSTIITRFPQLLGLSTERNLRPKWDYFVQMGRANSELVEFPQYLGYSLEKRIKPRYEALEMKGVSWSLNRMLSLTEAHFLKRLKKETELVGVVQNLDVRKCDGYQ
jgi:mTERF domain-containing protein